jgi:hypothetical protein
MISSEVERTLVKSPPELWTELSNPDALARHLGEFGEIRITRVEPEHEVEWQAGDTAGTVRIKPSGWGTTVTLTATREIAAAVEQPTADDPQAATPIEIEATVSVEPTPVPVPQIEEEPEASEPEPDAIEWQPTPEPLATESEHEPRLGFFRRLFGGGRGRKTEQEPRDLARERAQPDRFAAIREALAPERVAAVDPFSMPRPAEPMPAVESAIAEPARPATDIAADLKAAEEVTAVLTSVLDRLGAAHHRPFSRA